MRNTGNPQQLRGVLFDREDARRIEAFVRRVGNVRAMAALGIGESTLEAARDAGRMLPKTRTRRTAQSIERGSR